MAAAPSNQPEPCEPAEQSERLSVLEQELEALRDQHDQLLYSLSHDLRTPVMTILGFADMLTADLGDTPQDAQQRQYLEHIRSSAIRQSEMICGLLRLTNAMRQPLHPEPLNLTALCVELWQNRDAASSAPPAVPVTVKFQATPLACGDRQLLRLLLQELLDNAIKFAAPERALQITMGVEQQDAVQRFYLRDSGVGFDMERAKRLGQPFKRLHNKQYPGVGIGLAIATGIVQRHHGRLWLDSQPGVGTTVYFTLGKLLPST